MLEQQDIFECLERENHNSEIHPQIFELLEKQYKQLSQSVKADVQLLLGKNKIAGQGILQNLANNLSELLIEYGEQINSEELTQLVFQNLQPLFETESERFFKSEYTIVKDITDLLKEKMEYILGMYLYQDCMVELDDLVSQYRQGTVITEHHIDMKKKIDGLTYHLARNYKLHRDMKLYMKVNHVIEDYKNELNGTLESSLETFRMDHVDYIFKLKDTVCHELQEYQFKQYEQLEEEYGSIEKHLA